MASILKVSLLAIFLCVISIETAHGQLCSFRDLKISQEETGVKVDDKPEWNATVFNACICTEFNIQLSCSGFQTVEPIDPEVLTIEPNTCLLLKDDRIYGYHNFSFTYAWDTQYPFEAVSSDGACS